MKRLLLVVGPLLSIAGAVGLIMFGHAIANVFEGVLTHRIVNPPEPPPSSLGELGWVALSGMALAFGLAISCAATAMRDRQESISPTGRILLVVAGVLLLIGTIPVLWGILVTKNGFMVIATSSVAPKPDDIREMIAAASPMITLGCTILLIGSVVLLVTGQIGFRTKALQTSDTTSMLSNLAALGSLVSGVVLSLLLVGSWRHGIALEALLTEGGAVKPSELAEHLAGVLDKSLLAFIAVGCQGVLQAVAAIFARASSSDAVPEGFTDHKLE